MGCTADDDVEGLSVKDSRVLSPSSKYPNQLCAKGREACGGTYVEHAATTVCGVVPANGIIA